MSSQSDNELAVFKFTLSTNKVIYLREGEMGDMENATQVAGKVAGDNQAHLGMLMQKEMLKKQLVQVDKKKLGSKDKELLKSMFKLKEYKQALQAMAMVNGDVDPSGKPIVGDLKMEITAI